MILVEKDLKAPLKVPGMYPYKYSEMCLKNAFLLRFSHDTIGINRDSFKRKLYFLYLVDAKMHEIVQNNLTFFENELEYVAIRWR